MSATVACSLEYRLQGWRALFRSSLASAPLPASKWVAKLRMMDRNYEAASDEQLMAWSAEGERRAFDVVVGRHLGRALRTAMRIVGNQSDAEEIAQEAILRVWTNARKWKPSRSKLTTWLYQIVVNLSVDRQRRPIQESLQEAEDRVDPSPVPEAQLEERQRHQALARAIQEMPERQRAALILCCYEELSGMEAAEVLSTSLKAVESLLLRGRRFLKERLLLQEGGQEHDETKPIRAPS